MNLRRVSVVIPVLDRPEQLRKAISSALRQTYPVHEIIVVDDASQEPVSHATLETTDSRVNVIRLDHNVGPSAARWLGVERATGDLIAFLDSDDVWFDDKLEAQVKFLENIEPSAELFGVVCGWQFHIARTNHDIIRYPIPSSDLSDFASGCWFCPGSTLLIPKYVLSSVGRFDPDLRRLEDFEWFMRFALAGGALFTAPVVGARISKGRRAKSKYVTPATHRILERFVPARYPAITPAIRRQLRAWMHVERAAAARNEGRIFSTIYHLALSAILVPRTTIELKIWWKTSDIPTDARTDRR